MFFKLSYFVISFSENFSKQVFSEKSSYRLISCIYGYRRFQGYSQMVSSSFSEKKGAKYHFVWLGGKIS